MRGTGGTEDLYRTNQTLRDTLQRSQMRTTHYQKDFNQSTAQEYQPPISQTLSVLSPTAQKSPQMFPTSSGRELVDYYQSLAENYRTKFLALEKDFYFAKHQLEQENVRVRDAERQFEDKLRHEIDTMEQRYAGQLSEKD